MSDRFNLFFFCVTSAISVSASASPFSVTTVSSLGALTEEEEEACAAFLSLIALLGA